MKHIPTFRADGRRVRDYSSEAIDRLLNLGLIVVKRSRKGRITCAQFKSDAGANPLVKSAHMGQRYSYEQLLPSGHSAWRHRDLVQRQDVEALFGETVESRAELDLYIRAIFRAVPLSCIAKPAGGQVAATCRTHSSEGTKVVSIASGRGFAKTTVAPERKAA